MKKNNKILSIIVTLVLIVFLLILIPFLYIKNIMIDNNVYSESKNVQNAFQDYDTVRCKFNLLKPEYAFISYLHYIYPERGIDSITYRIDFYNLNRDNLFSKDWKMKRTGGTTVKNTTFPQLVKMVKDDCEQFKHGYLDYTGYEHLSKQERKDKYYKIDEKNLGWTYYENIPKTKEELENEEVRKNIEEYEANRPEEEIEAERQAILKTYER